ncbi:hypothetical protein [Clostridioides sp. ZZV15-6598]|uniref:hypothetical protein n=1 Tax=Clostridioides sp. ZZV15-6598 TaxID=2811501 RepID=UPI001D113A49|nr:hypothetical protein [Clostridioides sp. ZZV15-6598]
MFKRDSVIKKVFSNKSKEGSCCSFEIEEIKECYNDEYYCNEDDKTKKNKEKNNK